MKFIRHQKTLFLQIFDQKFFGLSCTTFKRGKNLMNKITTVVNVKTISEFDLKIYLSLTKSEKKQDLSWISIRFHQIIALEIVG